MSARGTNKHYLDTSVVVKLLVGSAKYKKYLEAQLAGGRLFVSSYVNMEWRRACPVHLLRFWLMCANPAHDTIADGMREWSNQFRRGALGAFVSFAADFLACQRLRLDGRVDKPKALLRMGTYIVQMLNSSNKRFRSLYSDNCKCSKGTLSLPRKGGRTVEEMRGVFEDFLDAFKKSSNCSLCKKVLVPRKTRIDGIIKKTNEAVGGDAKGSKKVAARLKSIMERDPVSCSCSECVGIGDAVIALECPPGMTLQTLDKSFIYLCDKRRPVVYPSESAYIRQLSEQGDEDGST